MLQGLSKLHAPHVSKLLIYIPNWHVYSKGKERKTRKHKVTLKQQQQCLETMRIQSVRGYVARWILAQPHNNCVTACSTDIHTFEHNDINAIRCHVRVDMGRTRYLFLLCYKQIARLVKKVSTQKSCLTILCNRSITQPLANLKIGASSGMSSRLTSLRFISILQVSQLAQEEPAQE